MDLGLYRAPAQEQPDHDRSDTEAEEQWTAHVAEVANTTLMPGTNSWYLGANIAGKPRTFLPYLDPAGVGGYRQKCDEVRKRAMRASRSGRTPIENSLFELRAA